MLASRLQAFVEGRDRVNHEGGSDEGVLTSHHLVDHLCSHLAQDPRPEAGDDGSPGSLEKDGRKWRVYAHDLGMKPRCDIVALSVSALPTYINA